MVRTYILLKSYVSQNHWCLPPSYKQSFFTLSRNKIIELLGSIRLQKESICRPPAFASDISKTAAVISVSLWPVLMKLDFRIRQEVHGKEHWHFCVGRLNGAMPYGKIYTLSSPQKAVFRNTNHIHCTPGTITCLGKLTRVDMRQSRPASTTGDSHKV